MESKNIRSAQFIDTYFPIVDGVVQTVNNYAAEMNATSYSCVVAPKAAEEYDDSVLPYDVLRSDAVKIPFWEYSYPTPLVDRKLKKELISKKLDIFHAHSPFTVGTFASSLAKEIGIPVVATFHSKYYDDCLRITKSKTIANLVTKKIVKFFSSVDSVWAVSHGTAETLHSYGYEGDVFVINNGTNFKVPENIEELKKEAAEKYAIPTDKKVILFVGHQIWHKNLKLVLDTFRLLCNKGDEYRLIIVGNGYNENQIKDYADKLNFAPGQVSFPGRITDRRLLSGVFACADLFFFPSVYDNAPLVVREAAAMGVPSLLVAGSNAAETVEKDISGFTAAEDEKSMLAEIERIFADEEMLARVGEAARKTIPVPWSELMPIVYDKYAELIDRKKIELKIK